MTLRLPFRALIKTDGCLYRSHLDHIEFAFGTAYKGRELLMRLFLLFELVDAVNLCLEYGGINVEDVESASFKRSAQVLATEDHIEYEVMAVATLHREETERRNHSLCKQRCQLIGDAVHNARCQVKLERFQDSLYIHMTRLRIPRVRQLRFLAVIQDCHQILEHVLERHIDVRVLRYNVLGSYILLEPQHCLRTQHLRQPFSLFSRVSIPKG